MHQFTLLISGLLADLIYKETGRDRVYIKEEARLDPRGLVRNDIKFIRAKVPAPMWSKGTTIEQVAYAQGQQDLIQFIETRVIGRRVDG